jgi:hypothetical protein
VVVVLVTVAGTVGVLVKPVFGVVAVAGLLLFAAVVFHPPLAAYALIASTPLIVGINRSALVPLLRPNEAVLVLLGVALIVHGLLWRRPGERWRLHFTALDGAFVLLGITSSVVPLLWEAIRHQAISGDDFLYSLTLWKYYGLFLVIRTSVRTERQILRCLWLSLGAACFVAVIAVLQSLQLFGIPHLLASYYAPYGTTTGLDINRGTATLASSIATGDVMAYNLGIALAMLARHARRRNLLRAMALLLAFGGLATGEFSAVIALAVVVVAIGILTRTLTRKVLAMIGVAAVGGLALQPVIARRLHDFSGGIPAGWADRLANLRQFFWPTLFHHFNFVLGVRPSPRIATPLFQTGYVWIESGHTWLLWSGGIPLFVAFVIFVWVALRDTYRTAHRRFDSVGTTAMAAFSAIVAMFVLMTFDPHLTLRGGADLLFSLLGLHAARLVKGPQVGSAEESRRPPESVGVLAAGASAPEPPPPLPAGPRAAADRPPSVAPS